MNSIHDKLMNSGKEQQIFDGRKVTIKDVKKAVKIASEALATPVIATMGANGMYHVFKKETIFGHTAEIS